MLNGEKINAFLLEDNIVNNTEKNVYWYAIRNELDRALSLLDNQKTSATYGSFDRTWWCWKFTDFSASRLQEGIFTLAWIYTHFAIFGYDPHLKKNILNSIEAAILFWIKLQHTDGSFDEAYPYERSLAATAFTSFYVGSALQMIKIDLKIEVVQVTVTALKKAGIWLHKNGEFHGILSNHLAAAAASLQIIGELTADNLYYQARDRYLEIIYDEQDADEGWLKEYAGADPGYQSHAMFYLADIWKRTGEKKIFACLVKAVNFIVWFMHPDGTLGGEYTSRGTKFAYPAAFEILSDHFPEAAAIAGYLRESIAGKRGIGLSQMDIWNFFPMLNNYIFAADNFNINLKTMLLPWQANDVCQIFSNAHLAVIKAKRKLFVIGIGGGVKVWSISDNRLIYEDCGYCLKKNKHYAVSQVSGQWDNLTHSNEIICKVHINSPFAKFSSIQFNPWHFIFFRGFTLTLGRIPVISKWFKKLLVFVLVHQKKQCKEQLERVIIVSTFGDLTIEDKITGVSAKLYPVSRNVPYHMGSTRYTNLVDWMGALIPCPEVDEINGDVMTRQFVLKEDNTLFSDNN